MNRNFLATISTCLLALFLLGALAGCSRDPNVRKQKYLDSGKKYMTKRKYHEASIEFLNALRLDEKFAEARYQLAQADLRLGLMREAYVELQRTVVLEPDNVRARLELGKVMLGAQQYTNAREQADKILAKDPNSIDAHILKSGAEAGLQRMDRALAEMNAAVEIDPSRAASRLDLARMQATQAPQTGDAEANYKKAIALDAKAASPRMDLARLYDEQKRFPEAEQLLNEAVQLAPKDQRTRAALVQHFLLQGNKQAAERSAKDAKTALSADSAGRQFLARYYLVVSDPQSALAEYSHLAGQYPTDIDVQHSYLKLAMTLGLKDVALKQIQFIQAKFPKDELAGTDKATLLIGEKRAAEARDILQEIVKVNPQNAVAQFELGNTWKMLGDSWQADSHWAEAAKISPTYVPAQKALAQSAFARGDVDSAAVIAKILLQKVPSDPDGHEIQAQVDALQNNAKDAELQLQQASALAPHSVEPPLYLGEFYLQQKRFSAAENAFTKVLAINSGDMEAIRGLVALYLSTHQPEKAMLRAQQTVVVLPRNSEAHVLLAELAIQQKNLDLAETELENAFQLDSSSAVYTRLAQLQLQRNDTAKAHATLQTAIQKNPKDADAYWMLGTLFDQENDSLNAESNYRKALELRPDFAMAANNLAFLLLQNNGNIDEAISFAELAHRKMPGNSEVADTLGWAYYQKGVAGLAVGVLQDAVKNNPQNAGFHYHLGMAYAKSGSREQARHELERALQLESDSARKDEIRKGLSDLGIALKLPGSTPSMRNSLSLA